MPSSYAKLLLEAAERQGLTARRWSELAGLHESNVSRLKKGEGTLSAARDLRKALLKLGEAVPPITLDGEADWLATWTRVGETLYKLDRDQFDRTVAQLREYIRAKEIVERGIQLIVRPLPDNPDGDG